MRVSKSLLTAAAAVGLAASTLFQSSAFAQNAFAAQAGRPAAISPVWGALSDLAGTTWLSSSGSLKTYAWKIPGEVMTIDFYDGSIRTISLDPSGESLTFQLTTNGTKSTTTTTSAMAVRPGVVVFGTAPNQQIMRISSDIMFQQSVGEGGSRVEWQSTKVPDSEVASAIAKVRQAQVEAKIAKTKQVETEHAQINRWGIYAEVAGKVFYDGTNYHHYKWLVPGQKLKKEWVNLDQFGVEGMTFSWNEGAPFPGSSQEYETRGLGIIAGRMVEADGYEWRAIELTRTANGYQYVDWKWEDRNGPGKLLKPRKPVMLREVPAEEYNRLIAAAVARRGQQAQRTESSGGGFLKVLQGAVGGLQGMADAGAGMSEALAGAAIGAAAGAAGVDAGAISQSTFEGAAKVRADNDRLRQMGDDAIADGLGRGTAEYDRKQAAEAERQRTVAQQDAATQEQARAGLARTVAEAEAVRAQQMTAAKANGDVARQQQLAAQSRIAQGYTQQYGVENSVQQQQAAQEQERVAQDKARREAEQQNARQQAAAASAERTRLAQADQAQQQRQREEDRVRHVEFKEGVVLCQQRDSSRQWRCQGPLQTTFVEFDTPAGDAALGQACGSGKSIRDLGVTSGYRAFGCGFGIHPIADDYPGNIDVPALLSVYVNGRATFRCPTSTLAYCRGN